MAEEEISPLPSVSGYEESRTGFVAALVRARAVFTIRAQ
jgi:hypothetical protein